MTKKRRQAAFFMNPFFKRSQLIKTAGRGAIIFLACPAFMPGFAAHSAPPPASAACASAFQDDSFEGEGEEYLDYFAASAAAASLDLRTVIDYTEFVKANPGLGLPPSPPSQYPDEFEGWGAFLQITDPKIEGVKQALRNIADDLDISLPHHQPADNNHSAKPSASNKNQLKNPQSATMPEARGQALSAYPPYEEFERIMREHDVRNRQHYREIREDIMKAEGRSLPAKPDIFYGRSGQWKGWRAVTGYRAAPKKNPGFPSYEKFERIVREHDVRGHSHYREIRKAIMEETGLKLPSNPDIFYGRSGQWKGWRAITGYRPAAKKDHGFPSLERFIELMRKHNIQSRRDFLARRAAIMKAEGLNLPSNPNKFYGPQWPGWRAVIGSPILPKKGKNLAPYARFAELMREYGVTSKSHYEKERRAIMEETGLKLPFDPGKIYGRSGQWPGWRAATGQSLSKELPSLERFIELMREHDITSHARYQAERKALAEKTGLYLHSRPSDIYEEWPGWRAVTGYGQQQPQ